MAGTWTCSEDEDFGSLGDNKVIVTGGTSGTPADFAAFVTADRAGEAVLLAATAGLSPTLALTYAIRPVEALALLISFIVASKTTETDYIFVTGTDFAGNAQTESLDVSAGNGTYVSTKYFATISNIDCSDNSGGGGTQWADGTVRATQPQWGFVWDYGLGQYRVDATQLDFGDASTSTYFQSTREQAAFNTGSVFQSTVNATLKIGELYGSYGINGSMWSTDHTTHAFKFVDDGTILLYSSLLDFRARAYGANFDGVITAKNSIIQHARYDSGGAWQSHSQFPEGATASLERVYFNNVDALRLIGTPVLLSGCHIHRCLNGVDLTWVQASATDLKITSFAAVDVRVFLSEAEMTLIDPRQSMGSVEITHDGGQIWEKYTCNIHVADRDGNDLQSVTVLCEDEADAQAFSVSTDAGGDIAEQTISYKKWADSAGTLTDFSPHKFTLSLAGYETLILEAITVGAPIVWHLELQRPKQPPAAWRH